MKRSDPRDELVSGWVRRSTGCGFAAALAHSRLVTVSGVLAERGDFRFTDFLNIEKAIEASTQGELDGQQKCSVTVVYFPLLTTASDVAWLLGELSKRDPWRVATLPCDSAAFVRLLITYEGLGHLPANVMGIGPFSWLPPTRRAPYIGLVLWAGSVANDYAALPKREIGLSHGPLPELMDEPGFRKLWDSTVDDVAWILAENPPPNRKGLHRTGFLLPCDAMMGVSFGEGPMSDPPR